MSWTKSNVTKPISDALGPLASEVNTAVSTINALLSVITPIISLVGAYYTNYLNPLAAFANTVLDTAQQVNDDLFGTGVYMITITGDNLGTGKKKHDALGLSIMTPQQGISAAIASFDDVGDVLRPQFSKYAEVAAVGFLLTAPNVDQFKSLIDRFLAILDMSDLHLYNKKLGRYLTPVTAVPTPPDWQNKNLKSIPEMRAIHDLVDQYINTARGYLVEPDINAIIAALLAKIAALQKLLNDTNALINSLANASGVYVLNVPPQVGGNELLKKMIADCPLSKSTNKYTVMTILVGGGPSLKYIDAFRKLVI